jgi:regulator of protease activity HflC (stomatin/prohibitin superfamily)
VEGYPSFLRSIMTILIICLAVVIVLGLALSVKIVKQYERGVLFRLGRVLGVGEPGFRMIIPLIDILRSVSLRIVTMPIQSQGIITRDNVSVDVSAVAYFRVVDAVKSVVAIENVHSAIDQIAQTTLRKVVGQHTLDETPGANVTKLTRSSLPSHLSGKLIDVRRSRLADPPENGKSWTPVHTGPVGVLGMSPPGR